MYFDWGDSCIWHPFISIAKFARHSDQWRELVPAYLEPWTAYGPLDRLMRAFELSQFLDRIQSVRSYVRIQPHLEAFLAEKVLGWIADLIDEMAGVAGGPRC